MAVLIVMSWRDVDNVSKAVFIAIALPLGIAGNVAISRWRKRLERMREGHCPACGYDLRASKDRCPECGREIQPEA
jgi:hypothetical protein